MSNSSSSKGATPPKSRWRSPLTAIIALVSGALVGFALNPSMNPLAGALGEGVLTNAYALFDLIATIFIRLLKMLVGPLVLFSIISGVASIGDPRNLGRLGGRTFAYYLMTSLLAVLTGLVFVNLIRPGRGANLPIDEVSRAELPGAELGLRELLVGLVPDNIFRAFAELDMLPIITFALLVGFALTRLPVPAKDTLGRFADAGFELFTRLAVMILGLLPIAVFALIARVAMDTDLGTFGDLALYALTVVLALLVHALVVLPLILRLFTGRSPIAWFGAVSPALLTAFSTASSSATLPVTMEVVEERGGVDNKTASFVLPLGATVNMDGTALYECVATIFLAQFYASAMGYQLTLMGQVTVVITALLASVGAAGIPSAGLVMMTVILSALNLPVEGALLLLAVDRPLDMLRTATNVWSDSVGCAVIERFEQGGPSR